MKIVERQVEDVVILDLHGKILIGEGDDALRDACDQHGAIVTLADDYQVAAHGARDDGSSGCALHHLGLRAGCVLLHELRQRTLGALFRIFARETTSSPVGTPSALPTAAPSSTIFAFGAGARTSSAGCSWAT